MAAKKKNTSKSSSKSKSKRPTGVRRKTTKARGGSTTKHGTKNKRVTLTSRRPSPRPKRRTPPGHRRPIAENPEALALAHTIAAVALEKKATDVTIIDMRAKGEAVGYDYIVLASGASDRQLEAIQDALDEKLKPVGRRASGVEASPEWVLVHYDDVVAHFFTPDKRHLIDLEGLWSDAPRVEVTA